MIWLAERGRKLNRHELLKKHFGYEEFRDGQESVIDNVMNKRDVFELYKKKVVKYCKLVLDLKRREWCFYGCELK
ncbi:MAG: hypothetical protein LR001_09865 [Clostridiales bacterium]|nr:hypothetical protein [Clostridiales bacterium]